MADLPGYTEIVTPLERLIRDRIRSRGPMPVSDYMALALSHPEYGYYRKRDPLGRAGDFITAPEISQAFGEIIGLWCVVAWQAAGRPRPVNLVEFGPGRGTLMADAVRAAATVPDFTPAAQIHMVESSPALRSCQQESLRGHDATWHDAIDTVPGGAALFIANEFFDALPVDQYIKTADGWHRRCIALDPLTDRLGFVAGDMPVAADGLIPPPLRAAPAGSIFERCPAGLDIAAALGGRLAADGIAALIIDYGHANQGAGDTLQAVRGHEYHDALTDPGAVDLTAHVDFHAIAAAAAGAGAEPFGPVPQGAFLSKLGIAARTEILAAKRDTATANLLRSGCRRLIDAQGMGTLFKVLALTDGTTGIPAGFEGPAGPPDHGGAAH